MKNIIRFDEHGDTVSFYKEGWNSIAQIDNIPEIVTVVKENMWSFVTLLLALVFFRAR